MREIERERERERAHLVAIPDSLCEDTIVVPQSITIARQLKGSHGVDKTSSQPSQSTITKTCILLFLLQVFKVQTKLRKDVCGRERERERENTLYM